MADLPGVEVTGKAGVSEAPDNLRWQVVLQLLAGFPDRLRSLGRTLLRSGSMCAHTQAVPVQQHPKLFKSAVTPP